MKMFQEKMVALSLSSERQSVNAAEIIKMHMIYTIFKGTLSNKNDPCSAEVIN